MGLGIIMVFSASAYSALLYNNDMFYYLKKQLTWALLGLGAMAVAMHIPYFRLRKYAGFFLIIAFGLLILVLTGAGITHKGSSRWLGIGSLSFQPSELTKLVMVIYMAHSLSQHQDKMKSFTKGVLPHLGILAAVCLLILAQPDLGTAVAIAGTSYLMMLIAGARWSHMGLLAIAGIALVAAAIAAAPYRMERFTAFLNPWLDPTGSGFQTIQSLLALGSGGPFGLGLGRGRQKLLFVPERHTDFIYAILGEELGFLGASLVIVLFFLFLWRGLRVAVTARDTYGSLLAAGITCMIALQAVINIGVVTGSLPVTGITLPFISYGGSSLVFTLAGVGILLNVSRYCSLR